MIRLVADGGATRTDIPQVSVLVPVTWESYPLERLYEEFSSALRAESISHEFVFVLPKEAPPVLEPLRHLQAAGEPIRILVAGHSHTEGTLSQVAREHTESPILLTLPSYPRVVPSALVAAVRALDDGYDLVTAARIHRTDSIVNRVQRRAFHFLLGKMVGERFEDVASGVRAMSREVLAGLDLSGDFFRFVPMLAVRDGFRVLEIPVEPHPENRRTRVYSPGVYLRRLIDLVGLMLLVRFIHKPLRFFGLIGSALASVGVVVLAVLFFERIGGRGIADRPMLLLGVLLLVIGLQVLALGLIGEIIVHHNVSRGPLYRISTGGNASDGTLGVASDDQGSRP
jgi:hypothetical protein